ncbi:MAG: stage III sporulation protein AF [Lachnospiraceae bacterium]|nr:stage III sporulation protein AF [Lachnospiraceae bacterium]
MISAWMRGLVIYLILSGIVMKLVPGKSYERYISLYMGLILVAILFKPVFMLFNFDDSYANTLMKSFDSYLSFEPDGFNAVSSHDTYYELGIGEAIKEKCREEGIEIYDISVVTDDKNNVLSITVYTGQITDENYLKSLINDVYKSDFESIHIVRR